MGQRDLPLASGSEHVKAFGRDGWVAKKKKAKHAHFILTKNGHPHALSIPDHREVKRALLQKQIKLAGMSQRQYLDCFHEKRAKRKASTRKKA